MTAAVAEIEIATADVNAVNVPMDETEIAAEEREEEAEAGVKVVLTAEDDVRRGRKTELQVKTLEFAVDADDLVKEDNGVTALKGLRLEASAHHQRRLPKRQRHMTLPMPQSCHNG